MFRCENLSISVSWAGACCLYKLVDLQTFVGRADDAVLKVAVGAGRSMEHESLFVYVCGLECVRSYPLLVIYFLRGVSSAVLEGVGMLRVPSVSALNSCNVR